MTYETERTAQPRARQFRHAGAQGARHRKIEMARGAKGGQGPTQVQNADDAKRIDLPLAWHRSVGPRDRRRVWAGTRLSTADKNCRAAHAVRGHSNICRVCGRHFRSHRPNAITCSSTCRQRLKGGGAFAYFGDPTEDQRRKHQTYHDATDRLIEATRESNQADREFRDICREHRKERQQKHLELLAYAEIGFRQVQHEKELWRRKAAGPIPAVIKLFVQQQRSHMSAEADLHIPAMGRP